jgi:hypothetical protein
MLIVAIGCSVLAPKANANGGTLYTFQSRQVNGATVNLGAITIDGAPSYTPLPAIAGWVPGSYSLTYIPAAGYYFVKWESSVPWITFSAPNVNPTTVTFPAAAGGGTITVVYQQVGLSVGGVLLPTNTFMILAPCFVVIGLVATAAVAIKRRRN